MKYTVNAYNFGCFWSVKIKVYIKVQNYDFTSLLAIIVVIFVTVLVGIFAVYL